LAIAASVIAVAERGPIIDEWLAVYPSNPALETSLQACATENRQFNRLSTVSRQACYDRWLPAVQRR